MTKNPKAVLFDLDGVLIESYDVWFHLLNQTARALGYPAISTEVYEKSWGQSTKADRDAFFPNHRVADVEAFYEAHYAEHLGHLRVPDAVPELFRTLAHRGVKSAVCTNTQRSLAVEAVKRAGAAPDIVVGGDDVPSGKPAPDMLLSACDQLDVSARHAWMIGDSRYDKEAATAARVHFIGIGIEGDRRLEGVGELLTLL